MEQENIVKQVLILVQCILWLQKIMSRRWCTANSGTGSSTMVLGTVNLAVRTHALTLANLG